MNRCLFGFVSYLNLFRPVRHRDSSLLMTHPLNRLTMCWFYIQEISLYHTTTTRFHTCVGFIFKKYKGQHSPQDPASA